MLWLFLLLAFLAGSGLPLQVGLNNKLRFLLGTPVQAALVQNSVGALILLLSTLLFRPPWPTVGKLLQAPWYVWFGGMIGAFYIFVTIISAPRLGAAILLSVIVAGQMVASLAMDHYGLVGFPVHRVSPLRILGALLLIGGVVLIRRF